MKAIRDKSILVIEDDAAMLRAITRVLRGAGAKVTAAERADIGLESLALRQVHFDLVITDLRMPMITGINVIRAVRKVFPTLPIIVLTAFGSPILKAICLDEGAFAFLEKPLDTAQLVESAERALEGGLAEGRVNY
jgi:DNA-binding NtrC family response regulator